MAERKLHDMNREQLKKDMMASYNAVKSSTLTRRAFIKGGR